MEQARTVVVVGGTGTIGERLIAALLNKPEVKVKAAVRDRMPKDSVKRERLAQLERLGVEIVAMDLTDAATLDRVLQGTEAVLSTLQGGPDVIVDGQLNLLAACRRVGVKRFLPTDFSGDYNGISYGDNDNYDPRKRFAELAHGTGTAVTHIMNGAFTEVFFAPFLGIFNFPARTATHWGTGDEPLDLTTIGDTVRYAAEAALDPEVDGTDVQVSGEVTTIKQLVADCEAVTGQPWTRQSKGTLDECKAWIEQTRQSGAVSWVYLPAQYEWGMATGKLRLTKLANARYPHIHPTSAREWLASARPDRGRADIPYHQLG